MPAQPRWLLAIPDAIGQLEQLDRPLLTRRDGEWLFGVSKARAATLMQDLRSGVRRQPANLGADEASAAAQAAPASGRVPPRGGDASAWPPSSGKPG